MILAQGYYSSDFTLEGHIAVLLASVSFIKCGHCCAFVNTVIIHL